MEAQSKRGTGRRRAGSRKRAYGMPGGSNSIAVATLEGMPDGVMLVDMDGKVIYVNKAFERMLGYRADELLGTSALELPTYRQSNDRKKARDYLRGIIEKESSDHIDMSAVTRDGNEIPISFTASVLRDAQGNPEAMVAVIRDISERKKAEEALRDSEELSRGMLEAASTGIYLLQDGCFQYVNRLFEELSGYTSSELKGTNSLDHVHPEDREMVRRKAVEVLKGRSRQPYEFRLVRKDSETIWVVDRIASIQYKGKRSVLGTLMDITESKEAEEEVRHYTKQLEALFHIGATVSQTLNLEELLGSVLDKVVEVTGVGVTAIFLLEDEKGALVLRAHRGMTPRLVQQISVLRDESGAINQVAKSGRPLLVEDISADKRFDALIGKNGGIKSFAVVPVMAREKILGVMGVGNRAKRDFPEWEVRMLGTIANQIGMAIENARLYEHALELAFTDSLTGLYNRRYFMEQIGREFIRANRSKAPLSLIMVDLDGLKTINDRFGHHEGDAFLREVAGIIRANTRASDVAARWGGDEFMLLTPETDSDSAWKAGERIRSQVKQYRRTLDGEEVGITISVGIVSYPAHASMISELLRRADEAMYSAKKGGKDRACVFSV